MSGAHDRLFREHFSDPTPAAWLVERTLGLRSSLGAVALLPEGILSGGAETRPDVVLHLARARTAIIIEHQTRIDPAMPGRAFTAAARLWKQLRRRQTPCRGVLRIVVYAGVQPWILWPTPFQQDEALRSNAAPFMLLPIQDVNDADLATAPLGARVCLRFLRRTARGEPALSILLDNLTDVETLGRTEGRPAMVSFLRYVAFLHPSHQRDEIMAQLKRSSAPLAAEFISVADELLQTGETAGFQRGEAAGFQRGEAAGFQKGQAHARSALRRAILSISRTQLGEPSEAHTQRLQRAPLTTLERWLSRATTEAPASWDDLLRP